MKRFLAAAALGFLGLGVSSSARAQYYPPRFGGPPSPTVSPYLNLLRPGSPLALNYYNLVRPQFDANASIQQLQGQVSSNQNSISTLEGGTAFPATGHKVGFQTQWRYFGTVASQGGLYGAPGAGISGTGGTPGLGAGVSGTLPFNTQGQAAYSPPGQGLPGIRR